MGHRSGVAECLADCLRGVPLCGTSHHLAFKDLGQQPVVLLQSLQTLLTACPRGNPPRKEVLLAPDDLHPTVNRLVSCQFVRPQHGIESIGNGAIDDLWTEDASGLKTTQVPAEQALAMIAVV